MYNEEQIQYLKQKTTGLTANVKILIGKVFKRPKKPILSPNTTYTKDQYLMSGSRNKTRTNYSNTRIY